MEKLKVALIDDNIELVNMIKEYFSSNAKITAKNITDIFTLDIPNRVPIAIPHIAECPRASEKKAILLFTIIVPNIANTGDTNIIAINAFFINV